MLTSCANSSDLEKSQIDFRNVPSGYTTEEIGYWASDNTGRTILTALRTYKSEAKHWASAYEELKVEHNVFIKNTELLTEEVAKRIVDERKEWKKEVRKAKRPGLGVFAGPAYCANGSFQLAVGVGLVWKLW